MNRKDVPVRVKVCGLTRSEDALLAQALGAWAMGFIFYRKSPRVVSSGTAAAIRSMLHPQVKTFGVFVNSSVEEVTEIARSAKLSAVQLHGEESTEFCEKVRRALPEVQIVKALRIQSLDSALLEQMSVYQKCEALLLDTLVHGQHGGTGKTFDWSMIETWKERLKERADGHESPRLIVSGADSTPLETSTA